MKSWQAFHYANVSELTPLSPSSPASLNALTNPWPTKDIMTASKPLFSLPSPPETPHSSVEQPPRRTAAQAQTFRQSLHTRNIPRPNSNPLTRSPRKLHKQQRDAFLGKVQQHREMKRWNVRSEQILQMDYITQRRAWEAEQARAAPSIDPDEVEMEIEIHNNQADHDPHAAQVPWWNSQLSQDSQQAPSPYTSQQLNVSQASQPGHQRAEPRPGISMAQAEIEAMLEAEQREMEELVAMHESLAQEGQPTDHVWAELPANQTSNTGMENTIGVQQTEKNRSSPPPWGSDDADFEEELWRLGTSDDMDMSGS